MSTLKVDTITDEAGTGAPTLSQGLNVDGGTIKLDGNYPVGSGNVALGDAALDSISAGARNIAIGNNALTANNSNDNTALGYNALLASTSDANVAVGTYALTANTTGTSNVSVGRSSLLSDTSGSYNVGVGRDALRSNTTASNNTAVGYQALYDNTTGTNSVAVGAFSLANNTTGQNTAMGRNSLFNTTSGTKNTGVGQQAITSNTTGNYNTALGADALFSNTTAFSNTAVGYQAGYLNQTGYSGVYVGLAAGYNATGIRNTFVGADAGSLITSGAENTIIGRYNGNQNGLDIRTSSNNIVLSDGDGNPRVYTNSAGTTFFGTTSDGNIALNPSVISVGPVAGQNGVKVELNSAANYVAFSGKGSNASWYFGHMVNPSNTTIGSIQCSASSVSYNTSSDYRLKENVVELTGATERLKQLNPSRFNFIADADTTVDGFLAHEVQSVVPEAIHGTHNEVDADGNPVYQGIDQSKLVPLLVATIKELEARITALENA